MRSLIAARRIAPVPAPVHPLRLARLQWVPLLLAATTGALGCGEPPSAPASLESPAQDETPVAPVVGAATVVADSYAVIGLGTLPGGTGSDAYGINRSRQVVGVSQTISATGQLENHAFLWSNGVMRDLGNFGPIPAPGRAYSQALAINDAGKVVGEANRPDGEVHAFLWANGTMQNLGTLGGQQSSAAAINAAGQVVGYSTLAAAPGTNPATHAFLWQNGAMRDLGTLGGEYSRAFGINSFGEIVGESRTAGGAIHAFRWANGIMTDLMPQGGRSQALAINRGGSVVGMWLSRAIFWVNGQPRLRGTAGEISAATGINTAGLVVGTTQLNGVSRALIWKQRVVSDLPAANGGPALGQAYAINAGTDVAGVDFTTGQAVLWRHQ
jgi:probable HAF family extracellular repeat protein